MPLPSDVRHRLLAGAALVLVCLVWGSTFGVVKASVAVVPTMTFLALRFLLAAVALAFVFRRDIALNWSRLALPGALAGFWLFAGYALQTVGLEYTQASRAGFITGMSVVLVPILSAAVAKEKPTRWALFGVGLAFAGLVFLFILPGLEAAAGGGAAGAGASSAGGTASGAGASVAGASGAEAIAAGLAGPLARDNRLLGDGLVLACAGAFATHITLVGLYAKRVARTYREAGAFASLQVMVAALCYLLVTLVTAVSGGRAAVLGPSPAPLPAWLWGSLALTGLVATAGAFLIQTAAQRLTPPTHTALILATEPVFAALFGWLILGERLGAWAWLGCLLILAGMLVPEVPGLMAGRPEAGGSVAGRATKDRTQ